jgi:hypothetical protein
MEAARATDAVSSMAAVGGEVDGVDSSAAEGGEGACRVERHIALLFVSYRPKIGTKPSEV